MKPQFTLGSAFISLACFAAASACIANGMHFLLGELFLLAGVLIGSGVGVLFKTPWQGAVIGGGFVFSFVICGIGGVVAFGILLYLWGKAVE